MRKIGGILPISVLVMYVIAFTVAARAAELTQTTQAQNLVTFNWSNQGLKQFWVNNSYLKCWFDGQQGGTMTVVRHYSNLTNNLIEDDKMVITGPQVAVHSSRSGLTPSSVNVSYTQLSPSSAKLVVRVVTPKGINFTKTYYFGDSEAIVIDFKITFMVNTNVTTIDHELALKYLTTFGSQVAYVNKTAYLNVWTLLGDNASTIFANSAGTTFPLKENWIAAWNTSRNLSAGIIYTNQPNLVTSLKPATIGLLDGPAGVATFFSRWYDNTTAPVLVPTGSEFEDVVIHWFGTGDYTQIRSMASMGQQLLLGVQLSAWISKYNSLVADYNAYKAIHNVTWLQFKAMRLDLDAVNANLPLYAVGSVIGGLIVGVVIGWAVKKSK